MYAFGVMETTTTTGTGNLTCAQVSGLPRINDYYPYGSNMPLPYAIVDPAGSPFYPIEEGWGYLSGDANTFVRSQPLTTYSGGTVSRLGGSAVSLAAGTKNLIVGTHITATAAIQLPSKGCTLVNSSHRYLVPANVYQVQTTGSVTAGTANRGYYFPVKYDFYGKVDAFIVRAGGTVTVDFALYPIDQTTFLPMGPALFSAVNCAVSSGVQAFTFTTAVLAPGWYYLYINQSSTATLTGRRMYAMPTPHFPTGTDAMEDPGILYESSVTQGTVPTSPAPGNVGVFNGTSGNGNIWPFVALRIVT